MSDPLNAPPPARIRIRTAIRAIREVVWPATQDDAATAKAAEEGNARNIPDELSAMSRAILGQQAQVNGEPDEKAEVRSFCKPSKSYIAYIDVIKSFLKNSGLRLSGLFPANLAVPSGEETKQQKWKVKTRACIPPKSSNSFFFMIGVQPSSTLQN